jgi:hypothetical protein
MVQFGFTKSQPSSTFGYFSFSTSIDFLILRKALVVSVFKMLIMSQILQGNQIANLIGSHKCEKLNMGQLNLFQV